MSDSNQSPGLPQRVLCVIPDAEEVGNVSEVLREAGFHVSPCSDLQALCEQATDAVEALVICEKAVSASTADNLHNFLAAQEAWSDLRLIVLCRDDGTTTAESASVFRGSNVTLLQRPCPHLSLVSCVQMALRARHRQYEVRDLLSQRADVLASIHDPFVMVDREWRFVHVNEKAAEMYGFAREAMIGRCKWDLLPHPPTRNYRSTLKQCMERQEERQVEFFDPSARRWYEKRIYPSGSGLSIFATDITERKQAEDNLRYQLGITQAITDNAADSLFLLDAEGRVTFMNPAAEQTFGWKKEELLDKALHDYVHEHRSRSSKLGCPLQSVLTSGLNLRDLEDQFRCKDGTRLYVSCSNAPIIIDGKVTGSVLVAHDITYRKLAEQQLKALNENLELRVAERTAVAEQRASQLTALASELTQTEQRERRRLAHILHDNLQQILVATKLQVGMVRQRTDDDSTREALEHVEELLTRSVDESRSLTVELSPPILYDAGLGRALVWLARRIQQEHNLVVNLVTDPEAEPKGDDIRAFLFQAVRESLFNIVKHAGVKEASVTLQRAKDGEAVLTVEDAGKGFDPNTKESQNSGSGGFGLFSIRERLEFLGGRMAIKSAPGKGTSLTLWIPRDRERSAAAEGGNEAATDAPSAPRETSSKDTASVIRVLLADDHKMLRDGLAGLLREQPDIDVVCEASDGQMAVELAHQCQPDVIIMDVTMPRMNGVEATRRISMELPDIKIIGLSMHEKEDMATAMREAGAVNYITKGAPSEILTAAIRNCMEEDKPRSGVTSGTRIEASIP